MEVNINARWFSCVCALRLSFSMCVCVYVCVYVHEEKCSFFCDAFFFNFFSRSFFTCNGRFSVNFLIRLICVRAMFCMNVMQAGYDDYQLTEKCK